MVELLPTQDIDETHNLNSDTQEHSYIWGRLLPLKSRLPAIELNDPLYTFGRGEDCSLTFTPSMFDDPNQLSTLSKLHFKIFLESGKQGSIAFIQDLSSNGTFINGTKIGRLKTQPLNNNDEISLSLKHSKFFVFSDSHSSQNGYPPEVTVRYTVSNLLGRGACGEVRLVFEKTSCERRAMKIVQKKTFSVPSKLGNTFSNRIQSEVDILMKLCHPCVIYIYDVIDTDDAVYMILELVEGGELFDRIVSLGQLPESDAKFLFLQMAIAVEYLHAHGITHRDLKPENILLENSEHRCLIKVTDFGLSKFVDGNTMLRTFCGTPTYLAPEILKTAGSGTYTSAIDIWSLGVILYVCLVGYPPFTDERVDYDLHSQIVNGLYDFPDAYWKNISGEAQDLVRRMLTVEPSERLTIQAVLNHPWLDDAVIKSEVYALIDKALPTDSTTVPTTPSLAPTVGCYEQSTVNEDHQQCIEKSDDSSLTGDPVLPDENTILQDKPLIRKRPLFQSCPLPSKQPAL
ncbi:Mitogen-activated protein kinase [Paragonimus heterotremus]|uniref:Mitogen-activated protein kinase n=1 Tax=Paragonimus heterotremus TaxID=100268 RepID=A0A8J4SLX4_9TREM|nr:Mitogen-activated protein kinase [Paragonimus heterotremus]